jgi:serine/threonine-protein kinase
MKVFEPQVSSPVDVSLQEARLLVDLSHPHIVRVYDANICDETEEPFAFVTMELARHGTLAALLAEKTRVPESLALRVGLQLASALAHTHSMNPPLIHRDVKPSNVLLFDPDESSAVFKLSDYGLASALDPETRLSSSGGTVAFAPPEMAWGVVDERGDVYGLGVTLYRVLTGVHPFPLTSPEELSVTRQFRHAMTRGRRGIAHPSRMLMRPGTQFDDVIMKCLEFDMFARFNNAAELLAELERVSVHE